MDEVFFAVIALGRLLEGLAGVTIGLAWKRWVVVLWGLLTLLLTVPVVALAFGVDIPRTTALAISATHLLAGLCVLAATISSRAAIGNLFGVLRAAGLHPERGTWRP